MVEAFVTKLSRGQLRTTDDFETAAGEVYAHEEFKATFPLFLSQIINENPAALVFLDRRARALSWAARRVWSHLTTKPMPKIYFVAPDKTDENAIRLAVSKKAKQVKLVGKVVVVDECYHSGKSIEPVARGLVDAGAKVKLAIYHKPASVKLNNEFSFIVGKSREHPGWSIPFPLRDGSERKDTNPNTRLFCDTTPMRDASDFFGTWRHRMNRLKEGTLAVTDELIQEMPKSRFSRGIAHLRLRLRK